jgi:tetratricopeptide (TPR) repeat protein
MQTSAEVLYNIGLCHLAQGDTATGEQLVLQALAQNDQLRFGEPYLSLATAFAETNPQKAMEYLQAFHTQNTSSCESYYRKATIHAQLGDKLAAIDDWHRCIETYQFLPNFRKRKERRWAVKARLRLWVTRR